ncbi:MAG: flagellar hook-basal body complex protein FliE [Treponema sp.]|jgi:flagellar hook-basal body complex protein FliE|nr:flagellar hook-basal body complex protein FliE [Treponema sp.]
MNIYSANAVTGGNVNMVLTNSKHMNVNSGLYNNVGKNIIKLEEKTGAEMVIRSGGFEQAMLQALDKVSADQQFASTLSQQAITDPDSVDIHDITIAQAKASLSLNIARNVLNRLVQGWKDIINTR